MGFDPTVETALEKLLPDTYGVLSSAGKEEFFNSFSALPPEKQQSVTAQFADLNNQFQSAQKQDNSSFVTDAYRNVLGRDPDSSGLDYWSSQLNNGKTKDEILAGMRDSPEYSSSTAAASASDANRYDLDPYSPVYGTQVGGLGLVNTPYIGPKKTTTYDDIRNFVSTNIADPTGIAAYAKQNGLSMADIGASTGFTPQEVQTYVNSAGNPPTDPSAALNHIAAVTTQGSVSSGFDRPADLKLTDYGTAVNGFDDYKYGDNIRGKELPVYGNQMGNEQQVDYNRDVQDAIDNWNYEESPAFKAKNTLTQEALMNSLSKRGIRGATTAGAAADQTRKLISEDYNNEREVAFQRLLQKYQANGLEYNQAYQMATQEYNSMYGAANGEYTTALGSFNNNRTAENASAWQGYNSDVNNALTQYQLDIGAYTDMYKNRTNEANSSYDKIINDIKIGQGAAGAVGTAGTNAANNISSSLNAAGAAASNAAMASGQAQAGLYSGMGNASAQFFSNPTVQKGLGNIWDSIGSSSTANMAANGTAIGSIASASPAATAATNYTGSAALTNLGGGEAMQYAALI